MINLQLWGPPGFKLVSPGSAVRCPTDCTIQPQYCSLDLPPPMILKVNRKRPNQSVRMVSLICVFTFCTSQRLFTCGSYYTAISEIWWEAIQTQPQFHPEDLYPLLFHPLTWSITPIHTSTIQTSTHSSKQDASIFFLFFPKNICCGYYYEYPQCMFSEK